MKSGCGIASQHRHGRTHNITTPNKCINNTSCHQPKVDPEPEIQAPRGKTLQRGVGDTRAAGYNTTNNMSF